MNQRLTRSECQGSHHLQYTPQYQWEVLLALMTLMQLELPPLHYQGGLSLQQALEQEMDSLDLTWIKEKMNLRAPNI